MQEGRVDVVSVEVINEEQLGLHIIYADEDVELLILPLNVQDTCPCNNLVFLEDYIIRRWNQELAMWEWGFIGVCTDCRRVHFIIVSRR